MSKQLKWGDHHSYPRQEVGSPPPPEPDPDIHGSTAAGTDVNGHLHDTGLDHNQQPHDRDPRRRTIDSSKEKCNNWTSEQTGFAHGVDPGGLQPVL